MTVLDVLVAAPLVGMLGVVLVILAYSVAELLEP